VASLSRALAAVGSLTLLSGCATLPPLRQMSCQMALGQAATGPVPTLSADGRTLSLRLDVATYNIEGLKWPARRGRAADLDEIGAQLAAMRTAGKAPDIVLFQEVFRATADRAVTAAGYPAQVAGPSRGARRDLPRAGAVPGKTSWKRGEIGFPLLTGGLMVASRYPIVANGAEPFSRGACAGLDCLANKGALHARIAIPGVPDPIEVFDTHMNSREASRAAPARTLAAHQLQGEELEAFMAKTRDPTLPTVLGGDFNMRRSKARFANFEAGRPLTLVHQYCLQSKTCDVRLSWDGDAPWLNTQDLQFFGAGRRVDIRPVRVEAMFDGSPGNPQLSDHDAFRVTYQLSWPADATPSAQACAVSRARAAA
jgi:endonuclease/exonuclease/phosphatase family metal-dependent hydrolase